MIDRPSPAQKPPAAPLPTGTLTFLLTDMEGSTRLWQQYHEAMRLALVRHDALIEGVVAARDGHLVRPRGEGDSRFAVFARASDAVSAACAIQLALLEEPWDLPEPVRVRIGVHTGEADLQSGDYYGPAVNHCARLRAAAHGGQVVVSAVTADLMREAPRADWHLRDLGEHHLKDLQKPERIWQVVHPKLQADFPPLTFMNRRRDNLPTQLSSFIGRQRSLVELRRLLLSGRLLTLTGPGGIGKTRLALALADSVLPDYADGVWLVELAALQDPSLVPNAVATALSVQEETHSLLQETLIGSLQHRRVLLVLDNCEHLVQACAELAEALLRACPYVRVLATSREPLRATGEVTWLVPALVLPRARDARAEEIARTEAGRLFVERGQAALPHFELSEQNARAVADVCRQLDGLPLALELAAAHVRSLGVEQLAARLDDRFRLLVGGARAAPPRQQTLRATLDWSYELLTESEQDLFERLSVFAGGWMLDAAQAVCSGEGLEPGDIPILLSQLVDRSLVVADATSGEPARYLFHETVRQYARECLTARGALQSNARRHVAYNQALAEQAKPGLTGEASLETRVMWLRRLEREHDNLRAALRWTIDSKQADLGVRLVGALWRFWWSHGLSEGRRWLDELLLLAEQSGADQSSVAEALFGAGTLATEQGDPRRGEALLKQSLTLFGGLSDRRGVVWSLIALGQTARAQGDSSRATTLLEEALALARDMEDGFATAWSLTALGQAARAQGDFGRATTLMEQGVALFRQLKTSGGIGWAATTLGELASGIQGDYSRATTLLEEALALARAIGDRLGIASALISLGTVARNQGNCQRAATLLQEALEHARDIGDRVGIARALTALGGVARDQGDYARATLLLEEGLAMSRTLGDGRLIGASLRILGRVAFDQGDYSGAQALLKENLEVCRVLGDRTGTMAAMEGLAGVAYRQEQPVRAAQLFGAAHALREVLGVPKPPADRASHESIVAAVRTRLGEVAFTAAWEQGRTLSPDQALAWVPGVSADPQASARA
jgi:predicted ATPase/class 3 adenylate cyclase